jgi:quercetin dioxygenase-like cupin family protein
MIEAAVDWASLPVREVIPGFHGRFAHSSRMTFVLWEIEAGAVLPEHEHPHEQVAQVLEGRFEITVAGTTRLLEAGQMGVVLPNLRHSGRAITACKILDIFAPVREDYRPGATGTVLGAALGR